MKMLKLFIAGLILAASTGSVNAGNLTIPNNFSANTTAVAADVNANFNAVESAVDDNDARITSNTSDISTNASNISNNASNISANTSNITNNASNISTNASNISNNAYDISTNTSNISINASDISSLSTQVTSLGTGYVSVHAAGLVFGNTNISCNTQMSINFWYITNGLNCGSTNGASLYFPLQLPHGLTVTNFGCGIYDASADGFVDRVTFYRQPINTGSYTSVSDLSADSTNAGYQTLSSGVLSHTVDNLNAAYGIRIMLGNSGADFSTIGSSLRIIGCTVEYQP